MLVMVSPLVSPERVRLKAVTPVGSVRSEIVAVKDGGDVIRPSSASLLRRPASLCTSGGSVSSSYEPVVF